MNMHQNARLTPKGRELLIERLERGEHPEDVACAMGVSVRTVDKWRRRWRVGGVAALRDRSSRPRHRAPDSAPARQRHRGRKHAGRRQRLHLRAARAGAVGQVRSRRLGAVSRSR